jgi:hypothetical protein
VVAAFASCVFFLLPLVLQALALSGQVARPGRWVPIAAVRQLAAAGVAFPAMVMVGLALRWEFPSAQAWAFAGVVEGLIEGALTGPVLLRLVREPGPG